MADCFSLPNAAELVEQLRAFSLHFARQLALDAELTTPWRAATAIETLAQENAKLKAERDHWEEIARERGEHYRQMRRERDAAVADIPKHCGTCRRFWRHENCLDDADGCGWEWRGVQKEEEE